MSVYGLKYGMYCGVTMRHMDLNGYLAATLVRVTIKLRDANFIKLTLYKKVVSFELIHVSFCLMSLQGLSPRDTNS